MLFAWSVDSSPHARELALIRWRTRDVMQEWQVVGMVTKGKGGLVAIQTGRKAFKTGKASCQGKGLHRLAYAGRIRSKAHGIGRN
jgi:hypothetical protein